MTYVQAFLSPELVQALGWTILHSLWQGALVALALSVLLVFLNRQSAQVRYFISLTALGTTLALAVFTFFSLYQAPQKSLSAATVVVSGTTFSAINPTVPEQAEVSLPDKFPFEDFFAPYFEKHLPLLVTFWFMGLLIMALRMLGGLAYVQRLKHYQTRPLSAKWQNKLEGLRNRLDLKKPVQLVESLQVKVPMVIGYLKPIILVPFGAVNGLSEKQVEAILAHELAHIYRHDYLFNLLQSFVETVFFYHPAMWWMNACVRAERENCCDDIAINLCGDTLTFAEALTGLEELGQIQSPALAMAFTGKKGSLLGRIKRLVSQPKRSASFTEGFLAACIVMVSISVISLSAMAQLRPQSEDFPIFLSKGLLPAPSEEPAKPAIPTDLTASSADSRLADCAPTPVFSLDQLLTSDDYSLSVCKAQEPGGKDIIIVKDKKGRIAELYVDGKKVRKKDMPALEKVIAERSGIPAKSKKKEYASKEDVAAARQALTENSWQPSPTPRVYVYNYPTGRVEAHPAPNVNYRYKYNMQVPNSAPTPPATIYITSDVTSDDEAPIAPVRPMRPMAPMRPMRPMKPLAPIAPVAPPTGSSDDEREDYEEEMEEYAEEMKEYEKEMAEFGNSESRDWKEYEQEMAEYAKEFAEFNNLNSPAWKEFEQEMAEFSKEMSEYSKGMTEFSHGFNKDRKEIEIRRRVETGAAARERARAAGERARAAGEIARAAGEKARAAGEKVRAAAANVRNERLEKLKAELRKDNLIGENDKNFTYKMSNEGLYINGKKQPQSLFEKYKKAFHPGMTEKGNYNEVYVIKDDPDAGAKGATKVEKKIEIKTSPDKAKDKNKVKSK
jgi:bla regulator protein BlaR1